MLRKILYFALSSVSLFAMHTAELNINDVDLEVGVKLDIGQYNENIEPDTTFIGVTFINANEEYSKDVGGNAIPKLGKYFNVSFLVKQEIKNSGLKVGLGTKAIFTSIDKPDLGLFSAIPLGVECEYQLPLKNAIPIWLNAQVYYAPKSLSLSDSKSYFEYRVGVNFEVIQRGTLFLGFRNIEVNYDSGDYLFNKASYFGLKFNF